MAGRYRLAILKIDGLETMGRSHARNSLALLFATAFAARAFAQPAPLVGAAAFGDWRADKPGVSRLIRPDELPKPGATPSAANVSHVVPRPPSALPQVPAGFKIALFAEGLNGPRQLRVAPNGDIFIAETRAGRLRVLRAAEGSAKPSADEIFASGLHQPFGIAFYPAGDNPQWVYVADTDRVVRFPAAISRPRPSRRSSSPNCRTAMDIRPGTSPSPATISGC
jgi:glucose/arabinose dehydrogenase